MRMPASNRIHSSAALQTHGIWSQHIGDSYAPESGGAAGGGSEGNMFAVQQGLMNLAKANAVQNTASERGSCKHCGGVGHYSWQCRNHLDAGLTSIDDIDSTSSESSESDDDSDSGGGAAAANDRAAALEAKLGGGGSEPKRRRDGDDDADELERDGKKQKKHKKEKKSKKKHKKEKKSKKKHKKEKKSKKSRRRSVLGSVASCRHLQLQQPLQCIMFRCLPPHLLLIWPPRSPAQRQAPPGNPSQALGSARLPLHGAVDKPGSRPTVLRPIAHQASASRSPGLHLALCMGAPGMQTDTARTQRARRQRWGQNRRQAYM